MQQDVGYTGVYVGFLFVWLWYQFYCTNAKNTTKKHFSWCFFFRHTSNTVKATIQHKHAG